MASYLSIEALTVSYGGPLVLDRVSLDVERGDFWGGASHRECDGSG